jgi:uncharacterized protein YyaL (SSP411 family)
MFRPSFSVTTLALVALSLLGFLAIWQRPRLPLARANQLAETSSAYLQQGSRQPVDWHEFNDQAFLLSRRTGMPILLVIGAPWSSICRTMDKDFFVDPETAGTINRTFIPVRLDGNESPEWFACLYPITRGKLGILPEFQMWVINPSGHTVQLFARSDENLKFNRDRLRESLKRTAWQYANNQLPTEPGLIQRDDRSVIRDATPTFQIDFGSFSSRLREIQTSHLGQVTRSGLVVLNPGLWQYQYATGQGALVDNGLDRLIFSPMFDAVDGGFYHSATASNLARISFDKVATENAAMAHILAIRSAVNGSKEDAELARMTADFIELRLGQDPGLASAQLGDERRDRRSQRQSFSPRRLQELPNELRQTVEKQFALRGDLNPLMVPFFPNPAAVFAPEAAIAREAIQKYRAEQPLNRAENRIASVEGYVLARLIDSNRVLGDRDRLSLAIRRVDNLSDFFLNGEILKVISDDKVPPPALKSYLGLADAYLSSYLADGRVTDLQQGEAILRIALKRYATGRSGVYRATGVSPEFKFTIADTDVPDIADGNIEASATQLMRLSQDYGRVLGDAGLMEVARSIRSRFAELAGQVGPSSASFFSVAAGMQDDGYFVAVGNDAIDVAMSVLAQSPFRLVVPAVGPVRRDLQAKGRGVYVVTGGRTSGPFSVPEAVKKLPVTFDVGA